MIAAEREQLPILWLHVGTHKTGTTSVQAAMADQADAFRARGIDPWLAPGGGPGQANAFGLAHAMLRPELVTPIRLQRGQGMEGDNLASPFLARFRDHVMASDAPAHLVSAEAFCFARTPREQVWLRDGLGGLFREIRPLLVLRGEAEWRQSWADQLRREGLEAACAALPDDRAVTGEWYFDRDAILAFWTAIGPVTLLDYEAALARDGSIVPALLRALGQEDFPLRREWFLNARPGGAAQ